MVMTQNQLQGKACCLEGDPAGSVLGLGVCDLVPLRFISHGPFQPEIPMGISVLVPWASAGSVGFVSKSREKLRVNVL